MKKVIEKICCKLINKENLKKRLSFMMTEKKRKWFCYFVLFLKKLKQEIILHEGKNEDN